MDADHLVKALARAVKVAEPAPEFCLKVLKQEWWTCMTKAEWSGWVQAVGSIAALYIALRIAAAQGHREQARAERLAYKRVVSFIGILRMVLQNMSTKHSDVSIQLVRNSRAVLQEALSEARSTPHEQLNAEWVSAFQIIRANLAQLVETLIYVEEVNKDKKQEVLLDDQQWLTKLFRDIDKDVLDVFDLIRDKPYSTLPPSALAQVWAGLKDGYNQSGKSEKS